MEGNGRKSRCPADLAMRGLSYAMIGVFVLGLAWTVANAAMMLTGA